MLQVNETKDKVSDEQFINEMCRYFSNRELIESLVKDDNLNLFSDHIYCYGDIMATHLLEPVKACGLGCHEFRDFQKIRFQPFDPEYLLDHDYTPENFAKVLKKEVELCKK